MHSDTNMPCLDYWLSPAEAAAAAKGEREREASEGQWDLSTIPGDDMLWESDDNNNNNNKIAGENVQGPWSGADNYNGGGALGADCWISRGRGRLGCTRCNRRSRRQVGPSGPGR